MEKEIEYKVLLFREEWRKIKTFCEQNIEMLHATLGQSKPENMNNIVTQSNHYFDYDEKLSKYKTVCRIRCFQNGQKPSLFFKTKDLRAENASFDTAMEFSQSLPNEEAEEILARGFLNEKSPAYVAVANEMNTWLKETEQGWSLPQQLKYLGSLTTERHFLHFNDVEFCFDHNHYFDQEDYELEIEGSVSQIQVALAYLQPKFMALCRRSLSPSKFQRFWSYYLEQSQAN